MNPFDWTVVETLSNLCSISGQEERVLAYLMSRLNTEFVRTDRLGSGLFQVGTKTETGVHMMIATHMDEVGFLVSDIDEHGYLKLQSVGNMWPHVLLNHRVRIFTKQGQAYIGIIGSPSVHALSPEKRQQVLSLEQLYVDLGVASKDEVLALGIQIGDMVCPATEMIRLANPNFLVGKAFDNRISVAVGMQVLQQLATSELNNCITLATTVQEEVGLRGARTVAAAMAPDIAFAVDTTLAGDTPLDQNNVKLGQGVTINVIDSMTVTNRGLLIYLEDLCRKEQIPYQLSCFTAGGTDAGNIHKTGQGIVATTLSIPMRYMHTHEGMIHKEDVLATYRLLQAVAQDMTREKLDLILEQDYRYGIENETMTRKDKEEIQCGE